MIIFLLIRRLPSDLFLRIGFLCLRLVSVVSSLLIAGYKEVGIVSDLYSAQYTLNLMHICPTVLELKQRKDKQSTDGPPFRRIRATTVAMKKQ